jgi:hypothetical protein
MKPIYIATLILISFASNAWAQGNASNLSRDSFLPQPRKIPSPTYRTNPESINLDQFKTEFEAALRIVVRTHVFIGQQLPSQNGFEISVLSSDHPEIWQKWFPNGINSFGGNFFSNYDRQKIADALVNQTGWFVSKKVISARTRIFGDIALDNVGKPLSLTHRAATEYCASKGLRLPNVDEVRTWAMELGANGNWNLSYPEYYKAYHKEGYQNPGVRVGDFWTSYVLPRSATYVSFDIPAIFEVNRGGITYILNASPADTNAVICAMFKSFTANRSTQRSLF